MMVVMPGAGSSWYVDSQAVGGPGDYEAAIGDDLPKAIKARFPVVGEPRARGRSRASRWAATARCVSRSTGPRNVAAVA